MKWKKLCNKNINLDEMVGEVMKLKELKVKEKVQN